ncbi:hypothetical protein A3J43_02125 [Candidatus Uhrbacteria bacterium RIFCSPHIGHO2_12_FULL_54_23]|uniref:Uncharacterized protein n=2 Tax=Candidatus Uhriibacteriota TaxID=1752732 RepID=A0A1F7UNY9_9BACT|nr:MAG: hypothetical protein A3J43_02125 [Candidatus Uhrbacteria bacterium RIFCSPHIGHO2_12_FULL_54_23]OGL90125.1 MAG: hypothetical protein A3J36_02355 [Candidatus Uhrbacteria bacterium RIFCSPLOWO2_02_FULL_54_37]
MPRLKLLKTPSLVLIAFTFWLVATLPVSAATRDSIWKNLIDAGTQTDLPGGTGNELPTIVGRIIRTGLTLLGTIFLVLIVYAGFVWILARGREEEVQKAQKIIETSVIGLVVIVIAYAISTFIFNVVIGGAGVK